MVLGSVPLLRKDGYDSLEPVVDISTAMGFFALELGSDFYKVILP